MQQLVQKYGCCVLNDEGQHFGILFTQRTYALGIFSLSQAK
jgi:hypothetical protein